MLLDPIDTKIALSDYCKGFKHSRITAFTCQKVTTLCGSAQVHGPHLDWHSSGLPEIRSKGKRLCHFARHHPIPLHGCMVVPLRTPASSVRGASFPAVCCLTWTFAKLTGEQKYLSLSFNLHCSYYE